MKHLKCCSFQSANCISKIPRREIYKFRRHHEMLSAIQWRMLHTTLYQSFLILLHRDKFNNQLLHQLPTPCSRVDDALIKRRPPYNIIAHLQQSSVVWEYIAHCFERNEFSSSHDYDVYHILTLMKLLKPPPKQPGKHGDTSCKFIRQKINKDF